MTAPNAELAYKVLDQIIAHPEDHNPGVWWCGTGGCFAGWTVVLSGGTVVERTVHGIEGLYGSSIGHAAELLLGVEAIPPDGDFDLFGVDNTIDDLRRLVGQLFGPRPAVTA